jgi:hypothetical protein
LSLSAPTGKTEISESPSVAAPALQKENNFVPLESLMLPSSPILELGNTLRIFIVSVEFKAREPVLLPCRVCAYFLVPPAVVMAEARTDFAIQQDDGLFVFGEFFDLPVPRGDATMYLAVMTEKNEIVGYRGFQREECASINGRLQLTKKPWIDGEIFVTLRSELSGSWILLG